MRQIALVYEDGYTPIHLMWMRKCHGDQQATYPSSTRTHGRLSGDSKYNDALKSAIADIEIRKKDCDSKLYPDLAAKVLGELWNTLCLFLHGTQSIIVSDYHIIQTRKSQRNFMFLHSVYALSSPLLPRSIVDLGLSIFPCQIKKIDACGLLPLHYACSAYATMSESCAGMIPGPSDGWNGVEEQTDCPIAKFIQMHPKGTSTLDSRGYLPITYAIDSEKKVLSNLKERNGYKDWHEKRVAGHCSVNYGEIQKQLIEIFPDALYHQNDGLTPFLQAAADAKGNSTESIYLLLRMSPELIFSNSIIGRCKN